MLIKSDVFVYVAVMEEGQAIDKGVLICLHRSEGPNEYKMAGNCSSYGITIKLDGSNYEIWSRVFMMSVAGHKKKYILEEDEPLEKKGIYATWDEDNNIVMSWIMNSVECRIAPMIAYYTKARDMWSFLKKTYSHATNVIEILQLEEELCNIRQGDQDLSQYFATLTTAYERLKALRPPCKHYNASYFETSMVAKFLSGLYSEYFVAKSQILIGSDFPDLADTYNRLSRLAVTLSQPTHDTPVFAIVISGGRGHSSFVDMRGCGTGRGARCGRFQCSYCGKLGHLEDRCWDKHPHLHSTGSSSNGGGRTIIRKGPSSSNAPSSHATASMVESPTSAPSYSLNLSKEEYDLVLPQRSAPASTNTAALESAFTVGALTIDPCMVPWFIKIDSFPKSIPFPSRSLSSSHLLLHSTVSVCSFKDDVKRKLPDDGRAVVRAVDGRLTGITGGKKIFPAASFFSLHSTSGIRQRLAGVAVRLEGRRSDSITRRTSNKPSSPVHSLRSRKGLEAEETRGHEEKGGAFGCPPGSSLTPIDPCHFDDRRQLNRRGIEENEGRVRGEVLERFQRIHSLFGGGLTPGDPLVNLGLGAVDSAIHHLIKGPNRGVELRTTREEERRRIAGRRRKVEKKSSLGFLKRMAEIISIGEAILGDSRGVSWSSWACWKALEPRNNILNFEHDRMSAPTHHLAMVLGKIPQLVLELDTWQLMEVEGIVFEADH
ncbi:hypothetical protein EJ110_NYTH38653 [Nymphaea thermarum]|nr:hypothetical protein EJ110_NYTH38653 [Nymphaea thermarum]